MKKRKYLFTSESVTEGHPDKMADQISDAILDAILEQDPEGRVACETVVNTGLVHVAGEITTKCYIDINKVVRDTILGIGYTKSEYGIDGATCGVTVSINEQSPDIAMGVDKALEAKTGEMENNSVEVLGAGDQGMMFGYACDDTPELMPLPIALAQQLTRMLTAVRKNGEIPYLRPDGKSQVTVEYHDGKPVRVDTIVIAAQHAPDIPQEVIRNDVVRKVIKTVIPSDMMDGKTRIYVNPTGRFAIGGPQGDAGLTGRKIIVDTYGGMGRHGGGCLSGKDPTKVDRSGCYAARYVAKNIVAAGLAERCEVQIAYAIGVAKPVSIYVDTFGTEKIDPNKITELVEKVFDLRPGSIIKNLKLRKPIYRQLAASGHFGRPDLNLTWEKIDKAEKLREMAGL
ncbi:MAG: methionine adenosyltransferase [Candidatus Eremiobacterota bacterium]